MSSSTPQMTVPFFRPSISELEIAEVVACLRSGWLTTGPRTREFETRFAEFVGSQYAVAVNSCTAALHLAVEALNLQPGQAVLVPTMTFAATAEVIRYQKAIPVLVDCDPLTLNMDLGDAEQKLRRVQAGELFPEERPQVVGIIPVHVGGLMMDMDQVRDFAQRHELWVVEDAAHALPAGYQSASGWRTCGQNTAAVTCYSFYANKTITTGEGGMATTDDAELADRMRQMSLHGLSRDGWNRHQSHGNWDYAIVAAGYKYNFTDICAGIGIHQLARAEEMRREREAISLMYEHGLSALRELQLPPRPADRQHAWHLYPLRLCLDQLDIDRNQFVNHLRERGVGFSVHWRPLHLHPYYLENFDWPASEFPVATREWKRLISLPIFPGMRAEEQQHVLQMLKELCENHSLLGRSRLP